MASDAPPTRAARSAAGQAPIRAAEVVGALSLATDFGMGQPLEHTLRTAVLAVRLGELAGASAQDLVGRVLRRVAALVSGAHRTGPRPRCCTATTSAPRAAFALVDSATSRRSAPF